MSLSGIFVSVIIRNFCVCHYPEYLCLSLSGIFVSVIICISKNVIIQKVCVIIRNICHQSSLRVSLFEWDRIYLHLGENFIITFPIGWGQYIFQNVCHSLEFLHVQSAIVKMIQTWAPQCEISIFNAMNEKSTIFVQSSLNFQKLTAPWMDQSLKVWVKLDQNCECFILK